MAVNETVERIVYEGVDRITAVSNKSADSVKHLRERVDGVKDALAAMGVTIGVGALTALYLDALKVTAALDDMAESTGATVEGLSAIQRVAKVGGHDFDGLTGQIGKLIKGLRETSEDGGKAARALDFLGVKARDSDGRFRDTSQILLDVAKKLGEVGGAGNQVALVQDILGKGAERYIPLLKEMAEGTDLHATVTAKQAAQAEEAEKNIRRLTLAFTDSRRELMAEYTPAVIRLTDQLLAAQKAAGGFWANLFSVSGKQADDPARALAEVEARLGRLRADRDVLAGGSLGAKFNRLMAPEDLTILHGQIAFAERQRGVLQELLARQQRAGAVDPDNPLFEFGGGGISTREYNPGEGFTPEEIKKRQRDVIEAAIRARNEGAFDKAQKELNPLYMTPEEREKFNTELVKLIIEQQKDVNEKVSRFVVSGSSMVEDDAMNPRVFRLNELRNSLKTEDELEVQSHELRLSRLQEFTDQELAVVGGRYALIEGMNAEHQARLLVIEQNKHQAQRSMEMGTVQLAGQLLQQFAGQSKGAALAVIAISKGLHIAQTMQATAAATMRAYADLGPIAGSAAAAYIQSLGAIQVGLIAATGLVEAGNIGRGPTPVGTFQANPSTGLPASTPPAAAAAAPMRQTVILDIRGGSARDEEVIERTVEALNEHEVNGGRVVVSRRRGIG
jgi:hypothetical protein